MTADVDLDGDTDMVVVLDAGQQHEVVVLENDGQGELTEVSRLLQAAAPDSVATGDWNQDGVPDLCVTTSTPEAVVYTGDGTAQFTLEGAYPLPGRTYAWGAVVFDADLDGNQDLVIPNLFDPVDGLPAPVSVFLGDGNAGFQAYPSLVGPDSPFDVATLDVNHDNVPDVAVCDLAGAVYVFVGDGTGLFTMHQMLDCSPAATWARAADVDGDELVDLVAGADTSVRTFLSTPGGLLGPGQTALAEAQSWNRGVLTPLDSDEIPDLLFPRVDSSLAVALGLGNGTFADSEPIPYLNFGGNASVADLDADGVVEVLLEGVGGLAIASSDGQGGFVVGEVQATGGLTNGGPTGVATGGHNPIDSLAADLDGDGLCDVLTAHRGILFESCQGQGFWENHPHTIHRGALGGSPVLSDSITVGDSTAGDSVLHDVDGDGDLDLIVHGRSNQGVPEIRVMVNDGAADFSLADVQVFDISPFVIDHFALGRADADSNVDLIVFVEPSTLLVRFGLGDGTFGDPADELASDLGAPFADWILGVEDIDGDADQDLWLGGKGITYLTLNDGAGGFSKVQPAPGAPTNQKSETLRDVNGDGRLDLIYGDAFDMRRIVVQIGLPGGGFEVPRPSSLEPTRYWYHVIGDGDLNADGNVDLLLRGALRSQGGWKFLDYALGDGAGGFASPPGNILLGNFVWQYEEHTGQALGDVDGDGDLDVVYPSFRAAPSESTDLNGDGIPDSCNPGPTPGRLGVFFHE